MKISDGILLGVAFICGCIVTSIGFAKVGSIIESGLHSIVVTSESITIGKNEK